MDLVYSPSRNSMILRSAVNILFGIVIILFPGISLLVVAIAFAINLLVLGMFMIFEPTIDTKNKHAVLTVMLGIVTVGAGVYLLSRPLAGIAVLSLLLAAWALLYGIIDIMIGLRLTESKSKSSWVFLLAGLISIVFAIYMAFNPLEGSLTLLWIVGIYSIAIGLVLAFEVAASNRGKKATKAVPKGKK